MSLNKQLMLIGTLAILIFAAVAFGPRRSWMGLVRAQAQGVSFRTVATFDGSNGSTPDVKPLAQGTDGNLYGTTPSGGANGSGDVFRVSPNGGLTVVYSFCAAAGCSDGNAPGPGVVLGEDGAFYGVTGGGGEFGSGTVFRVTAAGSLTTLHSFNSNDGSFPNSFLTQGTDGNFYGTTSFGGNLAECNGSGCGTVFRITPAGGFTNLYNFCSQVNCADGQTVFDGVALGEDGNFYGATWQGGADNQGTLYRITPAGALTTLYSFCAQSGCADGANPLWLTLGPNGDFFGTTFAGGSNGDGEVFRLTPQGRVRTVYSFCSRNACADGSSPRAGLLLGSDQALYGTTFFGGARSQNDGTVFQISAGGRLTTLHSFNGTNGANPVGSIGQATNGIFYGTASAGGADGFGTIFSVNLGLPSFVETVPSVGSVGQDVLLLGSDFGGVRRVTFGGTDAPFTVVSSTLIRARVPAGATTGEVRVHQRGGALSSNVRFRVIP